MAERLVPRILARGDTVDARTLAALMRGDLRQAARSSGVPLNLVRGWTGSEWGHVSSTFGEGGQRATRALMDGAPTRLLPSLPSLAEAFSPARIGQETVSAVRQLFSRAAWADGGTALRAGNFSTRILDPAVRAEVDAARRAATLVNSGALLATYHTALGGQLVMFYGTTGVAFVLDAADKAHLLDGVK